MRGEHTHLGRSRHVDENEISAKKEHARICKNDPYYPFSTGVDGNSWWRHNRPSRVACTSAFSEIFKALEADGDGTLIVR